MAIEINKFLVSFAAAVAGLQEPALTLGGTGGQVWISEAMGADAADPHLVLTQYAAPRQGAFAGNDRIGKCSIQFKVRGLDSLKASDLAWRLHESLLAGTSASTPRSRWTIAGKVLQADGSLADDSQGWLVKYIRFVNAPGTLGRDDNLKWLAAFNVDVAFERKAVAPL
jgi:hypothetical protein